MTAEEGTGLGFSTNQNADQSDHADAHIITQVCFLGLFVSYISFW